MWSESATGGLLESAIMFIHFSSTHRFLITSFVSYLGRLLVDFLFDTVNLIFRKVNYMWNLLLTMSLFKNLTQILKVATIKFPLSISKWYPLKNDLLSEHDRTLYSKTRLMMIHNEGPIL